MSLFTPLSYEEKYVHLQYPSGILASGEANFEDISQIEVSSVFTTSSPILAPSGLIFNQNSTLSNASQSISGIINDFEIFNPYIHYIHNPLGGKGFLEPTPFAFQINTSGFYNEAVSRFNIYNTKYRKLI